MKRLLWWLPALAVVAFGVGSRVAARPDDDFGQLRTTPLAPSPAPSGLPAGIQPDRVTTPGRAGQPVPNPYPLPPGGKPWMICAATYLGPDGAELARQLVNELRTKHRLAAYIYNRGDEERREQEAEWQERLRNAHGAPIRRRSVRVVDQYAVLIDGGFADMAAGTAYLPKVKALPLPVLSLANGKTPYDTMLIQEPDPQKKQMITRRANVNPFHNAMVVRNPALGNAAVSRSKFDPFWKELNSGESHCVLDNPKKYTLLVKEYTGARVIQSGMQTSGFLSALGMGKESNTLDAGAMQARELVRVLRTPKLGFQSWILHTRQSSLVFIGGFESLEDPELQRLGRQLSSLKFHTQGGTDPIGLMTQPVFVEVPRP